MRCNFLPWLGHRPACTRRARALLLEGLRAHPFLGTRVALKGSTAINLFILDLPRLSVDVDLNYVGAADRPTMLAERPRVEQALEQVASGGSRTPQRDQLRLPGWGDRIVVDGEM